MFSFWSYLLQQVTLTSSLQRKEFSFVIDYKMIIILKIFVIVLCPWKITVDVAFHGNQDFHDNDMKNGWFPEKKLLTSDSVLFREVCCYYWSLNFRLESHSVFCPAKVWLTPTEMILGQVLKNMEILAWSIYR